MVPPRGFLPISRAVLIAIDEAAPLVIGIFCEDQVRPLSFPNGIPARAGRNENPLRLLRKPRFDPSRDGGKTINAHASSHHARATFHYDSASYRRHPPARDSASDSGARTR